MSQPRKDIEGLIKATGHSLRVLAPMLGYASETSLRQVLDGRQELPEHKRAWLLAYVDHCKKIEAANEKWHQENPTPYEQ